MPIPMVKKPVFQQIPQSYDSGNQYMDVVNELLRKNRGSRTLTAYDTGSNTPSVLPEGAAVRPSSIYGGTNVGQEYGEQSYVPSAIQSTRTAQNQIPQSQGTQSAAAPIETYQDAIQRALQINQEREAQGIDEGAEFERYAQENNVQTPTEEDYINYFLDSRNITDPRSRNILSILLGIPSQEQTQQNIQQTRESIEGTPIQTTSSNIGDFAADTERAKAALDPNFYNPSNVLQRRQSNTASLRDRLARLAKQPQPSDENLTQDVRKLNELWGPETSPEEQQRVKDQQLSKLDELAGKQNSSNQPNAVQAQQAQTNPIRQWLGNAVDILGSTIGAGESELSEMIAGGPTINTGRKVQKKVGDFIKTPNMPSLVRQVSAAEPTPSMKSTNGFNANPQKAITRTAPKQNNIFQDIAKGAQNFGNEALSKAGQGVEGLKNVFSGLMDENILKNKDLSKMGAKNAVGEDTSQVAMEGIPGFAKSTPYSNNQDAFFKAGGAEQFKEFLNPGVTSGYRGSLNTSLFNDKFYENPDNVANVFGSTSQGGEATSKYKGYMAKQYPIVGGHDSPTVKKVATGKYDDGSEWRVEYEDVDPVYYENQYNRSVLDSIPAVLTSGYKFTAPRSGQKATAGKAPSGVFEPVRGDKTIPGIRGFTVPSQATNIRAQSVATPSNVFAAAANSKPYSVPTSSGYKVPTKSSTPSSSGFSTPTKSYSAPSSSYSAPKQSYSAPQQSYSAPKQTQSYSAPKPTPAPTPKPAPAPSKPTQQNNVFQNLVNTIKSWFKW